MNWYAVVSGVIATAGTIFLLYFVFTDIQKIDIVTLLIITGITSLFWISCVASIVGDSDVRTITVRQGESVELRVI
jgi:ABC-type transport system involved in cytochrome c biogenesis permease subunit